MKRYRKDIEKVRNMEKIELITTQKPGVVSFENYEVIKENLTRYVEESFKDIDYSVQGYEAAKTDCDELKQTKDIISKTAKELKAAYSAPYVEIEKKLNELAEILDEPYKRAKQFVDDAEAARKRDDIFDYARKKAAELGDIGQKVVDSAAFFNPKWLNKAFTVKKYQDEIDSMIQNAAKDIHTIQSTGGEHTPALMARYYETLSLEGSKSFVEAVEILESDEESIDVLSLPSEKNALGYKVLKITATEDQMAIIMDQLEMLGAEVEELEDGMPKPMEELTAPDFDSFVVFDIETTGTNGAASGDGEAKIAEIGAVRVVNGEVTEKFDELANPGRKIVPRIARLTHITDEMVADKPSVDEVIRRFREFVGDSIVVGHNIKSSDLRYITKAADKAGVHFDNPFLDTYVIAKQFKEQKNWEKLNLSYLSSLYGFEHKEIHRAWSDAEVNAKIYFMLKALYEETLTIR